MSAAPPQQRGILHLTLMLLGLIGSVLTGAAREAHDVMDGYGMLRCSHVEVPAIPKDLEVPDGKIMLIPDRQDRGGGRIAIYVTNTTGEALRGADSGEMPCFLQVRIDGEWKSARALRAGCGAVRYPPPADLESGRALILAGPDPAIGSQVGELRYYVRLHGMAPMASETFEGKYSPEIVDEAERFMSHAGWAVRQRLQGLEWRDPTSASTPGEIIAGLELERCSFPTKHAQSAAMEWLASGEMPGGGGTCQAALEAVLARQWRPGGKEKGLFQRAHQALATTTAQEQSFGSPERYRAYVWRHLTYRSHFEFPESFLDPERQAERDAINRSGNPWGVSKELVANLVSIAVASLESAQEEERDAAAGFLLEWPGITESLSDTECHRLAETGFPAARKAGAGLLAKRGRSTVK